MAVKQHEHPDGIKSIEQLEAALGIAHHPDNKCSGGQFINFRKGWAFHVGSSSRKAHYFNRDGFDEAVSFCGIRAAVRWLYGPGNYDLCTGCQRMAMRRGIKPRP